MKALEVTITSGAIDTYWPTTNANLVIEDSLIPDMIEVRSVSEDESILLGMYYKYHLIKMVFVEKILPANPTYIA